MGEIPRFDEGAMQRLLDGRHGALREQIREVMCRPEFAPVIALPTGEYRQKVLEWAQRLAAEGLTAPGFPEEFGGRGDFGANVAAFETVAYGDLSLLVKFGVQFGRGVAQSNSWGRASTTSATSSQPPRSSSPAASP